MGSMHWLDVVVVAVWLSYVWYGWGKGLFEAAAEVMTGLVVWGSLITYMQSFEFYLVRSYGVARDWAPFVAAILLISFSGLSVFAASRAVASKLPRQHYALLWHIILGTIPSIVAGGLLIMLSLLMLVLIPIGDLGSIQADASWFYVWAQRIAFNLH